MIKINFDDYEVDPDAYVSELTTEEKCRFCINWDIDEGCTAKSEAPFGSFECENNEKFEPYEE